jgi:hypothetical protein
VVQLQTPDGGGVGKQLAGIRKNMASGSITGCTLMSPPVSARKRRT